MTHSTGSEYAELRIVGGSPTPEELAAVTAVLTAALDEIGEDRARTETPAASAWSRTQRAVRGPMRPGPGAWRGFAG